LSRDYEENDGNGGGKEGKVGWGGGGFKREGGVY
jgi:hypothetical protein